jgi:hypothetical protein
VISVVVVKKLIYLGDGSAVEHFVWAAKSVAGPGRGLCQREVGKLTQAKYILIEMAGKFKYDLYLKGDTTVSFFRE